MITRIVKMTFRPEETDGFLELFEEVKDNIRNFPGCRGLTLFRDTERPDILFTYSLWENGQALESYRASELFARTWAETKRKFARKAEAWSVVAASSTQQ